MSSTGSLARSWRSCVPQVAGGVNACLRSPFRARCSRTGTYGHCCGPGPQTWSGGRIVTLPPGEVAARLERWAEVDRMLRSDTVRQKLIGESPSWVALLRQVVEVAAFNQTSVLLTGESGTGKELGRPADPRARPSAGQGIARDRRLHNRRADAVGQRVLRTRSGGPSPVPWLPATVRSGGLTVERYSSTRSGTCPCRCRRSCCVSSRRARTSVSAVIPGGTVNSRLVCATNRPLQDAVKGGQFRSDLYHRIAAWSCELPPLRQRRDDILPPLHTSFPN